MKRIRSGTFLKFFVILSFPVFFKAKLLAQATEVVFSVPISKPEKVSIDRFGNFYIADAKGNIEQFSATGKPLVKYSPSKQGKIALLEAWQGAKVFAYYEDFQQALYLGRFLAPLQNISLNAPETGFIRLATPSSDNNIWFIDESDFSLKKYRPSHKTLSINNPLNLQLPQNDFDITHIREYQNLLFISDKIHGIFVFDILGNYLKTLPAFNVHYFNFLEDEIYFIEEKEVVFFNYYNLKKRVLPLPEGLFQFTLVTKGHLILISGEKAEFVKMPNKF